MVKHWSRDQCGAWVVQPRKHTPHFGVYQNAIMRYVPLLTPPLDTNSLYSTQKGWWVLIFGRGLTVYEWCLFIPSKSPSLYKVPTPHQFRMYVAHSLPRNTGLVWCLCFNVYNYNTQLTFIFSHMMMVLPDAMPGWIVRAISLFGFFVLSRFLLILSWFVCRGLSLLMLLVSG